MSNPPSTERAEPSMEVTELKPCPFCGGTEAFVERADYSACYVQCDSTVAPGCACMARGPIGVQESDDEEVPGKAAAIAAWNRRFSSSGAGDAPVEPVAFVPYCFADSETAIEGEYAWSEIDETPFLVADPAHWRCQPLYAPIKQEMPEALSEEQKDAARYRWLTKHCFVQEVFTEDGIQYEVGNFRTVVCNKDDDVHAAIDAAIERAVIAQKEKN